MSPAEFSAFRSRQLQPHNQQLVQSLMGSPEQAVDVWTNHLATLESSNPAVAQFNQQLSQLGSDPYQLASMPQAAGAYTEAVEEMLGRNLNPSEVAQHFAQNPAAIAQDPQWFQQFLQEQAADPNIAATAKQTPQFMEMLQNFFTQGPEQGGGSLMDKFLAIGGLTLSGIGLYNMLTGNPQGGMLMTLLGLGGMAFGGRQLLQPFLPDWARGALGGGAPPQGQSVAATAPPVPGQQPAAPPAPAPTQVTVGSTTTPLPAEVGQMLSQQGLMRPDGHLDWSALRQVAEDPQRMSQLKGLIPQETRRQLAAAVGQAMNDPGVYEELRNSLSWGERAGSGFAGLFGESPTSDDQLRGKLMQLQQALSN